MNFILEACSSLPSGEVCTDCAAKDPAVRAAGCGAARVAALCTRNWTQVADSSINTQAVAPGVNLSVGNASGLEQAGGAEMWNRGVYIPGVAGLGPPGMMFVISCEYCREFSWYMLNQATLDRGPSAATCQQDLSKQEDNCWASGSAGEIDFLETAFWDPALYNTSQPDGTPNPNRNNSRLVVTSYNGAGRCFPSFSGVTPHGSLQPPRDSGGMCSNDYFVEDGKAHMYAAVVDRRGATVYRDPDWPGLTKHTASMVLVSGAPHKPDQLRPPCNVGGSCAINTPSCLTLQAHSARPLPKGIPDCLSSVAPPEWNASIAGHCTAETNWWELFDDTGQHVLEHGTCDTTLCPYPVVGPGQVPTQPPPVNPTTFCDPTTSPAERCPGNLPCPHCGSKHCLCPPAPPPPPPGEVGRCMPHPFICCNSGHCENWDGVDAQNCSGGNESLRWSGWDALQKCSAACEHSAKTGEHIRVKSDDSRVPPLHVEMTRSTPARATSTKINSRSFT